MSTVRMSFTPDPAYVRTVRMVAAAVARRAGVADDLLDEVRLAIGEACTRAVAIHRRHELGDPIDVAMSDGGRFTVKVTDRGPAEVAREEPGEVTSDIMARSPPKPDELNRRRHADLRRRARTLDRPRVRPGRSRRRGRHWYRGSDVLARAAPGRALTTGLHVPSNTSRG